MFLTKLHTCNKYLSDINLPIEAGDYKLISKKALHKYIKTKRI